MRFKFWVLFLSLICGTAHAGVTSYDHTFSANDQYSSDFHTRLNQNLTRSLVGGINNIESANITDGTLASGDFSTAVSPITRTYEGAACEFVYSGLLPSTDSDLTSDISAGTAYPRGYRCNKSSATAKTYGATAWTYVDLDQNCDFQYSQVVIDAASPAVASNSIRLARVSTDSTTINTVTDLRKLSCAAGPFNAIRDASSEASLGDLMRVGRPVRNSARFGRPAEGFVQGLQVSWDTHTTFKVTTGGAVTNTGKYRVASSDITVPQTADAPATGVSGIDTGAIAGSTRYYVYAVGDQPDVSTFSSSYSTSQSSPSGIVNHRIIGSITTDANALFVSSDIAQANSIDPKELISSAISFNGANTVKIFRSYNISSITDNAAGDYTLTFDIDYTSSDVVVSGTSKTGSAGVITTGAGMPIALQTTVGNPSQGAVRIITPDNSGSLTDKEINMVMVEGDTRN